MDPLVLVPPPRLGCNGPWWRGERGGMHACLDWMSGVNRKVVNGSVFGSFQRVIRIIKWGNILGLGS